jgi:hypothetical protein
MSKSTCVGIRNQIKYDTLLIQKYLKKKKKCKIRIETCRNIFSSNKKLVIIQSNINRS